MMDILLLILIILSALLLIILIMLQDESGEGLGGIFGGGSSTPFGSRSGNILTRITAILATVFIVCTLGLAFLKRTPRESGELLNLAREQKYEDSDEQLWYVTTEAETETTTTIPDSEDDAGFSEGYEPSETSTTDKQ
ncbi:MAG: preprotein translocase subunit SecG [Spirochaetales bacterium]|nr:preprotein translocase subunit SecG [Spirochaetales bacterium]